MSNIKWHCQLTYDAGQPTLKIEDTKGVGEIIISISKSWANVDIDKETIKRLIKNLEEDMGTRLDNCFNFLKQ